MVEQTNTENAKPSQAVSSAMEFDTERINVSEHLASEEEDVKEFDSATLEQKSLEDLIALAQDGLVKTPKLARQQYKEIKPVFFEIYNREKDAARASFVKENNSDEGFEFEKASLVEDFIDLGKQIKQAQEEEKRRVEEEKQRNLEAKQNLLKTLEELVEKDETLESINQVKEIQKEWKAIRVLPKDTINELWSNYNALLDKFYDNHSINIELKELDRQKNLEAKIELTKKVEALLNEPSLKRSFILLNKYHEEFKNIGPVPQLSREPIWEAFKKASDAVYDQKRSQLDELRSQKEENLKKKQLLVEKASVITQIDPESNKQWNSTHTKLEELFEEWKTIGPVPKANNDKVWKDFNGIRNEFYKKRKEHFAAINEERKSNLVKKEALCQQVEALQNSEEWAETTKKILDIQKEWKSIGPVPDKVNQAIWKRFRKACDAFFNRKNEAFAGKREEEKENLNKKEELLIELDELLKADLSYKEALGKLKEISQTWKSIGFVPRKAVKRINNSYKTASNAVYDKYKEQAQEFKAQNLQEHFTNVAESRGVKQLQFEERKIKQRIGILTEEIAGIERNMSFFASSKTADKMLKEFEQKTEKLRKQIENLKGELKVLKTTIKKQKNTEEENT
jgi:hypothetical protein